eukprot:jgi/Botrbrau1/2036/Bobra.0047s0016.1
MGKKAKGKHRLDKFYKLAKEQGFRSRAAFKLIQLNQQHHFLEHARACIDLCAAPGGWMQVARKTMPLSGLVVGVDLVKIKPVQGCVSLLGDITKKSTHEAVARELGSTPVDVVLHDGAPNVGGAWASEAYTQSVLVLEALRCATRFLVPNGAFVTKIFRSQDYNALLYAFKELFKKVDATKPAASRDASAEIFVVCLGYRAPAKIDPRLLDPKHLFKEVVQEMQPTGPDALLRAKNKQKRHRQGYEDGLSTTHRAMSAAAFVIAENPIELLGKCTRIDFCGRDSEIVPGSDNPAELVAYVRHHKATTQEVQALAADLPVLGRSEFKLLLKWRGKVARDLEQRKKEALQVAAADEFVDSKAPADEDADEVVLEEMAKIKSQLEARERKAVRRKRELTKKARIRAAQMSSGEGLLDATGADSLFSLASIQGRAGIDLLKAKAEADEASSGEEDHESQEAESSPSSSEDSDSEDERMRYDAELEAGLDEAYQSFLERHRKREGALAAKRARLGQPVETQEEDEVDSGHEEEASFQEASDIDEDGGGLLVQLDEARLGRRSNPSAITDQWFSGDVFKEGIESEDNSDEEDHVSEKPILHRVKPAIAAVLPFGQAGGGVETLEPNEDSADGSDEDLNQGRHLRVGSERAHLSPLGADQTPSTGFEEVPMSRQLDSEDDSDEDLDNLDNNAKAEILAVARKMLQGRNRQDILDMAYHRYNFHDEGLPRWFVEDEQRHCRMPELVTKADVEREKESLRAIDTRPIKKLAEAKARKQKRLAARIEAAKQKAEVVAAQEDLSSKQREKQMAMIMARAKSGKGAGKGKLSRSAAYSQNKKRKPLDKRQRADQRQVNLKIKKKLEKKKKRKGGFDGKKRKKQGNVK